MKKIALLIIGGVLALTSCELDRMPETSIKDDSFWKTENDIKLACNYFYVAISGLPMTEDNRSDDSYATTPNSISDGSRITPNSSGDYGAPYERIRWANNILEKAELMNLDPAILCKYKAEAKFFRAWNYFELVKKYGDVPLILKTLDIYSPELKNPRTSKDVVVDTIYADLDYAAMYLTTASSLAKSPSNYGRATETAALALKSRVALYVGTHQKFHNYGTPDKHLQIAVDAANQIMALGYHKLYVSSNSDKSYHDLFHLEGEGVSNRENILVRMYGVDKNNLIASHNFSRNVEQGTISPTRSLVESYLCTDGLPASISPLAQKTETNSLSIFVNKDPRLNATVYKTGDLNWLTSNPTTPFSPTIAQIKTGFACKKYVSQSDWLLQQSFIDRILIRYAEVLLNYAEAKFELNNGAISNEDLDKSINLIRTRAGMPKLTNEFVAANGLDMRNEIRRERRVELALEGFRYEDIIRWKIAEQVLPQAVLGAKYFKDEYAKVTNPTITAEGYFVVQPSSKRKFDPQRDYLYPIPIQEIALTNGAITQNPNW